MAAVVCPGIVYPFIQYVQDSEHPSPLIRALAIRTMGCIRVEKIVEYLTPPLKRALGDIDPYVRKTAAIAVAKLHDISPLVVKQQGFLDNLRDLLSDSNPTVVANAVAALNEIQVRALACLRVCVLHCNLGQHFLCFTPTPPPPSPGVLRPRGL